MVTMGMHLPAIRRTLQNAPKVTAVPEYTYDSLIIYIHGSKRVISLQYISFWWCVQIYYRCYKPWLYMTAQDENMKNTQLTQV